MLPPRARAMPSKLLRRSGYRTRFVLLVLVMMTGMLGLVPVMRNYHEREEMLLRRLKLQEMEPKGPTPPRMPIDDLLQMLPDIPRVVNSTIPKLIHQSYKTTSLPGDFRHYQKSWHRNHPTWLYQFWTDEVSRCCPGMVDRQTHSWDCVSPPYAARRQHADSVTAPSINYLVFVLLRITASLLSCTFRGSWRPMTSCLRR